MAKNGWKTCPTCRGNGEVWRKCPQCNGKQTLGRDRFGNPVPCTMCTGGEVSTPCGKCNGVGEVPA